jgi:transposase
MVWVPRGEQPVAQVNWQFKWLWLAGFVHPQSGETYWWIVPRLNTWVFSRLLAEFAEHFGINQSKRVVLAVDQATFHTTQRLRVPEGIHLVFLPSHSPELQPAERLWPLTNEPIANRTFKNLDELEEVAVHRCQRLLKQRELIRGLTCYHWWPLVAS